VPTTMTPMSEADRRAVATLDRVWSAFAKGSGLDPPAAAFSITTGWASGDTVATSPDWLSPRPVVRVNLGNHADGKALLVHLLHLAAHGVAATHEEEERRRKADQRIRIATMLGTGMSGSSVARELGISDATVYRLKDAIAAGKVVDEDEEHSPQPGSGGVYHSQYFRDAAKDLGLRPSKNRLPGRGFDIVAGQPLAPGTISRYRKEISELDAILPAPHPEVPAARRFDPVYLNCECVDADGNPAPRSIRMPNGPGRETDKLGNITCDICGAKFHLAPGASRKSGFPRSKAS
jgi:Helix-turn-helix domain of resolvase